MILKTAFAAITLLALASGIFVLTGEIAISATLAFVAAVISGISLAYLIGRDTKKQSL